MKLTNEALNKNLLKRLEIASKLHISQGDRSFN
jgi:hypothetical protein